jgi:hypothetical protein
MHFLTDLFMRFFQSKLKEIVPDNFTILYYFMVGKCVVVTDEEFFSVK